MEQFKAQVLADLPTTSSLFQQEDLVYLVSKPWWDYWMSLPHSDSPSPIDNLPLFDRYDEQEGWKTAVLRADLEENKDFIYVSQAIWRRLIGKFRGGPEIIRNVIAGLPNWDCITLEVVQAAQTRYLNVSCHLQMSRFKQLISEEFHMPESRFVIALTGGDAEYSAYSTLEEMGVKQMDQVCVRERRTSFLEVTRGDDEEEDLAAAIKLSLQSANGPAEPVKPRVLPEKEAIQARVTASMTEERQDLSIKKLQHTARRLEKLQQDWEGCV